MYGTHSERSDTAQLLGLLENKQDVFTYKDSIAKDCKVNDLELKFSMDGSKSPSLHQRKGFEFDETSLHSAPSMSSLESEISVSRHESEVYHN